MSQKRTFQQLDSSENSERPSSKQKVDEEVKTDERADNIEVGEKVGEKVEEENSEDIAVNFCGFDDINLVIMDINYANRGKESIFDAINKANKIIEQENNKKIAAILKDLTRDVKERVIKSVKKYYPNKQVTFERTYSFPVENLIDLINKTISKIELFQRIKIVAHFMDENEVNTILYAVSW